MRNAYGRRKKLKRVGRKKRNGNAHWNVHEKRLRRGDWWSRPRKSAGRERLHPNRFVAGGGCEDPCLGEEGEEIHHPRRAQVS